MTSLIPGAVIIEERIGACSPPPLWIYGEYPTLLIEDEGSLPLKPILGVIEPRGIVGVEAERNHPLGGGASPRSEPFLTEERRAEPESFSAREALGAFKGLAEELLGARRLRRASLVTAGQESRREGRGGPDHSGAIFLGTAELKVAERSAAGGLFKGGAIGSKGAEIDREIECDIRRRVRRLIEKALIFRVLIDQRLVSYDSIELLGQLVHGRSTVPDLPSILFSSSIAGNHTLVETLIGGECSIEGSQPIDEESLITHSTGRKVLCRWELWRDLTFVIAAKGGD